MILKVCESIKYNGCSLLDIVGHVAARVVIYRLGARACGCGICIGGHLVAVGHNSGELGIGLFATDGYTSSYGGTIEAVPCVDGIIAAALGQ